MIRRTARSSSSASSSHKRSEEPSRRVASRNLAPASSGCHPKVKPGLNLRLAFRNSMVGSRPLRDASAKARAASRRKRALLRFGPVSPSFWVDGAEKEDEEKRLTNG